MKQPRPLRLSRWSFLVLLLLSFAIVGCGSRDFTETFDSSGSWGQGDDADATGQVANGVYDMYVKSDSGLFWSTAGKSNLDMGTYELEATQTEGPLDNGYGLIFRVDNDLSNFLLFEISSDGFVWIGWCGNGCETTAEPLVGDGWFESKAIREGLNAANNLRVVYDATGLVFSVNGQEVGSVSSLDLAGLGMGDDIGLLVETLGHGGVRVAFDNVRYTPLVKE